VLIVTASADSLDNWTMRLSENNYYLPGGWARHYDAAYGNGSFVAVGHYASSEFGTIYSSANGAQWTRRSQFPNAVNPTFGELRGVTFAAGLFVTVGRAGTIYTSSDGINWALQRAPSLSSFDVNDVAYGRGLFVAVGDAFDASSSLIESNILTSNNGINWVPRRVGSGTGQHYFLDRVACGATNVVATGQTFALTSANGTDWTSPSISLPGYVADLTYARGLYVAVGQIPAGQAMILTSTTGSQWISRNPGTPNRLLSVTYGMGFFLATGESVVLTSNNGIDWRARTVPFSFRAATVGNGTAVTIHEQFDSRVSQVYQSDSILNIETTPEGTWLLHGRAAQTVQIETSSTLLNDWQPWTTITLGATPYAWSPDLPEASPRFYRAVGQ
jgi:hypothetical protein